MPPFAELTDAELAVLLADSAKHAEAFAVLYERHAHALLAFAASRFRQRAEDLCQNAWMEAFKHSWGPTDNFRAWLFRVVSNRGISAYRKERTVTLDVAHDLSAATPGASDRLEREERIERLKRCREMLRKQKPGWDAVIRAFLDEEAPAAAAERLGISRPNYDQRKSRALDALARCVGSDARGSKRT